MAHGRILIAPDSFKGTFTAVEVAGAIGRGVARLGLKADLCPVADGGEGTVEASLASLGGRIVQAEAHDPRGRCLPASFALLGETGEWAMVETAAASGLALLAPDELDPWGASTYGTGELIAAAIGAGAKEVIVAVGGSATVDGGRGALEAIAAHGGLRGAVIEVLCDVQTTWERCAEIYGPQKGADGELVARLAARLDAFAAQLPRDPRGVAMSGAAGGLSGGLWAALDARLRPGAPYVLDLLEFEARLHSSNAVITGEGRLDSQSALGKVVGEIASRARAAGKPAHAIVGEATADAVTLSALGLGSVTEAGTLAEIERAATRVARGVVGG